MNPKKVITIVVVLFVGYTILHSPERSGQLVTQGLVSLAHGANHVGRFFDALIAPH